MKKSNAIIIILISLFLISPSNAQTGRPANNYDLVLQDDYWLGINTNAPKGSDVLNHNYVDFLEISIDIWNWEILENPITSFSLSLKINQFPNGLNELRYNYTNSIVNPKSPVYVSRIQIRGLNLLTIKFNQNNGSGSLIYVQFNDFADEFSIEFEIKILGLSIYQVGNIISFTLTSFSPYNYPAGVINFDSWLENLPIFFIENILFAIVSVGIIAYSLKEMLLNRKLNVLLNIETSRPNPKEFAADLKSTKEVTEIVKDTKSVAGLISRDRTTKWISKLLLPMVYIYLFLLTASLILGNTNVGSLIQFMFIVYSSIFIVLTVMTILFLLFNINIIKYIGRLVPPTHYSLIGVGLSVIGVISILSIYNFDINSSNYSKIITTIFLILSTIGFGITASFTGYYLGRSGISWKELSESILTKLKIPLKLRLITRILLTTIFFGFLTTRVLKTLAAVITLYTTSEISNNAYLITLAAVYMQTELSGSILLIYGVVLLFILQGIMQLYLHIIELQMNHKINNFQIRSLYKLISMSFIVFTINFIFIFYSLNSNILNSGFKEILLPSINDDLSVYEITNNLLFIAPFKLLMEMFLTVGVIFASPFAFFEMIRPRKPNPEIL